MDNDTNMSNDDIFSTLEAQFDRVTPQKLSLEWIYSTRVDSMSPTYFLMLVFFSQFDKMFHFRKTSFNGGGFLYKSLCIVQN